MNEECDDCNWKNNSKFVLAQLEELNINSKNHAEILNSINISLVKYNACLEKHMTRTEIAEQNIELLKDQITTIHEELLPLSRKSWFITSFLKITVGVSAFGYSAIEIIRFFTKGH